MKTEQNLRKSSYRKTSGNQMGRCMRMIRGYFHKFPNRVLYCSAQLDCTRQYLGENGYMNFTYLNLSVLLTFAHPIVNGNLEAFTTFAPERSPSISTGVVAHAWSLAFIDV